MSFKEFVGNQALLPFSCVNAKPHRNRPHILPIYICEKLMPSLRTHVVLLLLYVIDRFEYVV